MIPAAATTFSGADTRAMVFSFLYPEDKAAMVGVSRTFRAVAWKPTYSPMIPSGERQAHADAVTLAYYHEALGHQKRKPTEEDPNKHVLVPRFESAEEGRKEYILTRRFERLSALLGPGTFLRAQPQDELGVEAVKISSLDRLSFWPRIREKIRFYSGYEHDQSFRSVVSKFETLRQKWEKEDEVGQTTTEFRGCRDWILRRNILVHMAEGIKAAEEKHSEATINPWNFVMKLVWKVVQMVVWFFSRPLRPPEVFHENGNAIRIGAKIYRNTHYPRQHSGQPFPNLGFQVATIQHENESLSVHADIYRRGPSWGIEFAISKDGGRSKLVACCISHKWTEEVRGFDHAVTENTKYSKTGWTKKSLKDYRLSAIFVGCSEAAAMPEQLSSRYASLAFQLIAEIFDQGGEQKLELCILKANDAKYFFIQKGDSKAQFPIDGEKQMVRWEQFRQEARIHPIFKDSRPIMPRFFEWDRCLYG